MTVYIFGEFNNGFSSWPNDATSERLKKLYKEAKAPTQIVVHRYENIMHYCYLRKLGEKKYIGFCFVRPGEMVTNIDKLFPVFEKEVEDMVKEGCLLHFTPEGKLDTSVDQLYQKDEAVKLQVAELEKAIDTVCKWKKLPPWDFSVKEKSQTTFSIEDELKKIVDATGMFGYTYIYKEKDYDTVEVKRSKAVINNLYSENKQLKEEITKPKKRFATIMVSIMILVLLACGVCIAFFINKSDDDTDNPMSVNDIAGQEAFEERPVPPVAEDSLIRDSVLFHKFPFIHTAKWWLLQKKDTVVSAIETSKKYIDTISPIKIDTTTPIKIEKDTALKVKHKPQADTTKKSPVNINREELKTKALEHTKALHSDACTPETVAAAKVWVNSLSQKDKTWVEENCYRFENGILYYESFFAAKTVKDLEILSTNLATTYFSKKQRKVINRYSYNEEVFQEELERFGGAPKFKEMIVYYEL